MRGALTLATLAATCLPASAIHCSLSAARTESLICQDQALLGLDDTLNHVYRAALAKSGAPATTMAAQKRWLAGVRAACTDTGCLKSAYLAQLAWLQEQMAPWCQQQRNKLAGAWQRAGDGGFFELFAAGPGGAFDSWLHQRPEISGGTWQLVACTFVVESPSGLRVEWVLLDLTASELRAVAPGVGGVARYRRTGH